MDAAVCFSGGKDSALAALVLDEFYDVTLVTATFGVTDDVDHARSAADALGFPFATVDLDRAVAEAAVDRMLADGFPRNGIQQVHQHAVEVVAAGGESDAVGSPDARWDAVADGTRRDDRVPKLDTAAAQSLEDRLGVDYLAPLAGIGRDAIDAMVADHLDVETGPSETLAKADYESELRALIAEREGQAAVDEIFPAHTQSRVVGWLDR